MIYYICFLIVSWAIGTQGAVFMSNTENAALLYYQAFLLRLEPDAVTQLMLDDVLHGSNPSEKVRDYLAIAESRETIRIAETATQILHCSWGIMRWEGVYNLTLKTLLGQVRELALLLEVDARTLVADGDHLAALDRCLRIRRIAQHIGDEATLGYLASLSLHGRSFLCIQHVLCSMSPDTYILTWLQSQLSTLQGAPPSPGRAMVTTLDDALKFLSIHPEHLATWRENISKIIEDESAMQQILSLTDGEILEKARDSYNRFLVSVNRVIGSDMPYQQKYLELQALEEELEHHPIGDPVGILQLFIPNNVVEQHDIYVREIANFNAIRAAIEIYLFKAKNCQLPEMLPTHLPEDPFSGQDFEYEATSQGFVLRCREKEKSENKVWEYEFLIEE